MMDYGSTYLPKKARDMLRAAVSIEPHLMVGDSERRTAAIAAATAQIKEEFPAYFQEEIQTKYAKPKPSPLLASFY